MVTSNTQNTLRGRENPLPDITEDPEFTRDSLERSVAREYQEQFNVSSSRLLPLQLASFADTRNS